MGARGALRLVGQETVTDKTLKNTMAEVVRGAKAVDLEKPEGVAKNKELSEVWDWLVPELVKTGLAAKLDVLAIEMAIRHYVHAVDASNQLLNEGLTRPGRDGESVRNPLEIIFRSESTAFIGYTKLLGLTFASRVRLANPTTEKQEVEEQELFNSPTVTA